MPNITTGSTQPTAAHVLVVADWRLDPHAVIARLAHEDAERHATWTLLVPAWLHGRDWAGDPGASRPCAEAALMTLRELAVSAGLDVDLAVIGDPDPVTAVADTSASVRCDAILLCTRRRRFSPPHALDLAHRIRTSSAVPVTRVALPTHRRGHCAGAAA